MKFKVLYQENDISEIVRIAYEFTLLCLTMQKSSFDCYMVLHDLGVKPIEVGWSIALALQDMPDNLLNDRDKKIKKLAGVLAN